MTQLVVGALIVDDLASPTVLLAARRNGPPSLRGKWEFPGGKVMNREAPEDALVRELNEELGIDVELGTEFKSPSSRAWLISEDLEMRLWFAIVRSGRPEPIDSHDELRWLDTNSLYSVDWLEADLKVLPHLLAEVAP